MTDIPIIDAIIAFQPYNVPKGSPIPRGAVAVLTEGDANIADYGISWRATLSQKPEIQFADILLLYRHLTAMFGVSATDADEALMVIPEYRSVVL